MRRTLTPAARAAADAQADVDAVEADADAGLARYCLVEAPDGDWPTTRLFKTAEGLAKRIAQIDGDDVAVWAFYGVPLRITKGPQRHVLLQDGASAIAVPRIASLPAEVVDADEVMATAEIQEDGFLGPAALADSPSIPKPARVKTRPAADDDEDEDDEDEDDEDDD